MSDTVDCVVIGAGVVGLAVARALALAGREVIVLEKERWIGAETSSRNSEVIHAGLYYPKDSLKARFCVAGRAMLYAYCAERGVAHRRIGKLVIACNDGEIPILEDIGRKAEANGVSDLDWVGGNEARALEPEVTCARAFYSPSTGIIDSHGLMLAYQADLEAAGGMVVLRAPMLSGKVESDGFSLDVGGAEPTTLRCRILVNSAGIHAPSLARCIAGIPGATIPRDYFCRGVYFTLSGRAPFRHLVYPVPEPGGLGIHVTLDLGGQARFGPDVEWIDGADYAVDPRRGERFYAAIRRYWPGLPDNALQPGYAGIRPKISGPKEPAADFLIQGPADHGVFGLVNLYGIESPGLTASLAIARHVVGLLGTPAESAFPGSRRPARIGRRRSEDDTPMAQVTALQSREAGATAERETRIALAACYRLIAHFGMDDLVFTHISARVPGSSGHFLINPYGMMFHEITASSLVKIDYDGSIVEDTGYPVNKAGFVIHSAVHMERPNVNCVLHTHTRAGIAVSCLAEGLLPINQHSLTFYNRLAYHDYEGIALDLDERTRLVRDLGDKSAMILRNHGLLTVGRTVQEAFSLMFVLEKSCQIQLDLMASGGKLIRLSDNVCQHTAEQFANSPVPYGDREWPALLRLLDAKDPSYRS